MKILPWVIETEDCGKESREFRESIFSLGNGYMGTRGYRPEQPGVHSAWRSTFISGFFEYIQSRPQIKMICISQNNLCLNILFQFSLMYSFHTADCTYRHKYRGLYLPVVCCNQTGTGITFCVCIL